MKFEDNNWRDPLRDLAKLVRKKWSNDRFVKFNVEYRSYRRTLEYLRLICGRIKEDVKLHREYNNAYYRLSGGPDGDAPPPTKSDLAVERRWIYQGQGTSLYLDMDDFFIHSNILMDKIARIASVFLEIDPPRSFSKHKGFLCKKQNTPFRKDEDYAKYIRESTSWFETDLKDVRDDLVVHEGAFWAVGTSWGKKGLLSASKMSPPEVKKRLLNLLRELRKKYRKKLHGIDRVEDNLWILLQFFEQNIDQIDKKDEQRIKGARKKMGGRLPPVPKVADEIFYFLTFFSLHFQEKI